MRKQYGLKFEEDLIARIDAAAEAQGSNRTAYIEEALREKLDGSSDGNSVKISPDLQTRIEAYAEPAGLTQSEWIEEALEGQLIEAGQRTGELPPPLASEPQDDNPTNKKVWGRDMETGELLTREEAFVKMSARHYSTKPKAKTKAEA